MTAEILCVGTELLLGNILNTDAKYLSQRCADLGLSVFCQTVVGDNAERLEAAFMTAYTRSDVVITTGGLGPTNDDITKETISRALGLSLIEDAESRTRIEGYFKRMGKEIAEINYKQAMVPEGSTVLENDVGTAPAVMIHKDGKLVFMLPGPLGEMRHIFETHIAPYFSSIQDEVIYSETLKVTELGESPTAQRVKDILENSVNPTVSPYAKFGETHLRITAKAESEDAARQMIEPVKDEIYRRLGEYYIYTDDISETLESKLIKILKERNLTIATAESCTGGMLSAQIVNVPGASDVFKYGFVTYSNDAKIKMLGVKPETISEYTEVSAECAGEMAEGAARLSGADVALSVTGYASEPLSLPEMKGVVFIGCFILGNTYTYRFKFGRDRQAVRKHAAIRALDIARRKLLNLDNG